MNWKDPERAAQLKKLWEEGHSCSTIARMIGGVTRNAVIGAVTRARLPHRGHVSNGKRTNPGRYLSCKTKNLDTRVLGDARPSVGRGRPFLPELKRDGLPLPTPKTDDIARVSVMELKEHQCKWPVGDPAVAGAFEPLFCGSNREPGKPYCLHHVMRAEAPVPVQERRVRARELQVAWS